MVKRPGFKSRVAVLVVFAMVVQLFSGLIFVQAQGDSTPPVVTDLEVSPKEVSVGEKLIVKADIQEDISGVNNVWAYFSSPSGNRTLSITLRYDEASGLYEGTHEVSAFDEEGLWKFNFLYVSDNASNTQYYYPSNFQEILEFRVNNVGGDSTPPVVTDLEVSPKEVSVGEKLIVKADIQEDISGVNNVWAYFSSPSGNRTLSITLRYDEASGLYEGTHEVSAFDEEGLWKFNFLYVSDNASNTQYYYPSDFQDNINKNFIINYKSSDLDNTLINNSSVSYVITNKNETWIDKNINKDLYIGPNSTIYIADNVTINGNVYVYGTLVSYGGLTINGTLNAKSVSYYGDSSSSPGTVKIVNGQNSIRSMSVSNGAYDVPFIVNNENLTNETGTVEMTGQTLPFLDVSLQGKSVSLGTDGSFNATAEQVTSDNVKFTLKDSFGNNMQKEVKITDVLAPPAVTDFKVTNTTNNEIQVNWSKNSAADLKEYQVYLDGQHVDNTSADSTGYTYTGLEEGKKYELSVAAMDVSGNKSEVVKTSSTTSLSMPVLNPISDKDTFISGKAFPQTTIKVYKESKLLGTGKTETDGTFKVQLTAQTAKTTLQVTATNESGVVSEPASIIVDDKTAPKKPTINAVTDRDKTISGTAEANSTVAIKIGADELAPVVADAKGIYSTEIKVQKAGVKISVTAADASGNVSEAVEVVVKDATPPAAPTVEAVSDKTTEVVGEAESASIITVKTGETVLGKATANAEGRYSVSITKQKAGLKLQVSASDAAGNTSEAKEVTVTDGTPPSIPVVNEVTDQSTSVSGTTEANASVLIKSGKTVIGSAIADATGAFTAKISKQKPDSKLAVIAFDEARNGSESKEVTVKDITAPLVPVVEEIKDNVTTVKGTAEAGSTISIKNGSTVIGTGTVNKDKAYSVTIPVQKAGTIVTVTVKDAAGHVSKERTVTVKDGTAPVVQSINEVAETSTIVTGVVEAGAIITIKIGSTILETATAPASGKFSIAIPKQKAGVKLTITAADSLGNVSKGKELIVKDTTAPTIPTVNAIDDNDLVIAGKVESGAKVYAYIGSKKLGEATAKSGSYSIKIAKQKAGTSVSVYAVDAAGNKSTKKTIKVIDKTAPIVPSANTVSDKSTTITGKAESGAKVYAYVGKKKLGEVTAKNGAYSIKIAKQKAGTSISVYAIDPAKNKSGSKTIKVVDKTAPAVPTVNKVTSKSTTVTGKGEKAATVLIYNGSKKIGQGTVDSKGNFKVKIKAQKKGSSLKFYIQDKAKNKSKSKSVKVS